MDTDLARMIRAAVWWQRKFDKMRNWCAATTIACMGFACSVVYLLQRLREAEVALRAVAR